MWICVGEHGVSFAIETPEGSVLFDTGHRGEVLLHNAAEMGLHLDQFDALALSHAHYNHTGGLESFLKFSRPGISLFANESLFQERYAMKQSTVRREFEGRSPHHYIQDHGEWLPDRYQDDLSLVMETNEGVVIVCGCCHAGLLNTLLTFAVYSIRGLSQ